VTLKIMVRARRVPPGTYSINLMFSPRVPARLEANALTRAIASAQAAGRPLIDLTVTNPTRVGLTYPAGLFHALSAHDVASYRPQPFGLETARRAVADDYARRGIRVAPDRVILTASTSEAYSLLFKLLCASSGDSVMVPVPSYPLFEHLTGLDGVDAVPYRLDLHDRWSVDRDSLAGGWRPATRAVLAVSPNNPTGSVLGDEDLAAVDDLCAGRDAALIVDEVFADYPLLPSLTVTNGAGRQPSALTFRLGGLSKSVALPQLKLGWIAVDGPDPLVAEALDRLELICDTYLSVSTPVQVAAQDVMHRGAAVRQQLLDRVRANDTRLRVCAARHPAIDVLPAEAGWSAVLRVPAGDGEEALVVRLVQEEGIIVHPGFFFDFPREAYIVVSLLPEPDIFESGVSRVLERVDV
jgi:alanine-synthesizing transaminase